MNDVMVGETAGEWSLLSEMGVNGGALVGWAVAAALLVGLVAAAMSQLLQICGPNEILVISGRRHTLNDGSVVGYKVLHGGRSVRIPILEEVNRMDTRLILVMVEVHDAYSKGGIPLSVHAVANVKITTDRALVRNAIERLLSMETEQIALIAQQTLEGVLREVVAALTPEEVNEDRLKFAATLMSNAKDDFDKLGLELDVLKVQSVSDEQSYLKNLGRELIANMLRDAENAENSSQQVIVEAESTARQRSETATKQSEAAVLTFKNQVRAALAKLEAQAKSVENEADLAQQTARSRAEQELQRLRSELEKKRLEVDITIPAEAKRMAAEAGAAAEAAPLLETGKATAEALQLLAAQWQSAGDTGRNLYVLQNLDKLVLHATRRVANAQVSPATVVDGGDGSSYAAVMGMYPAAVMEVLTEMGQLLGVDIPHLLKGPIDAQGQPGRSGRSSADGAVVATAAAASRGHQLPMPSPSTENSPAGA